LYSISQGFEKASGSAAAPVLSPRRAQETPESYEGGDKGAGGAESLQPTHLVTILCSILSQGLETASGSVVAPVLSPRRAQEATDGLTLYGSTHKPEAHEDGGKGAGVVDCVEVGEASASAAASEPARALERLYEKDQLKSEQAAGRVLHGFCEARPRYLWTGL